MLKVFFKITFNFNNGGHMNPEEVKQENTPNETIPQAENTAPAAEEDVNWKKFRQEREADRKRREEAEAKARKSQEEAAALKAAMDALLNKNAPTQVESDPDFEDEEVRIQKKVEAALEARERAYLEKRRQEEQAQIPLKLRQSYPDYDQVCSDENLDYLEYNHGTLYKAFATMPDGYEKWSALYDAVKKLIPNTNAKKNAEKAEKNMAKPGAMSRGGMTQTGDSPPAFLDKARRQANWERMNKIIKGQM